MANLEIRFDFDRERTYRAGDVIRGKLTATVDAECFCTGLWVSARWCKTGRGTDDWGDSEERELFTGTWEPGSSATYPFEITVPTGAWTYHGKFLHIDWYLSVRAQVPRKFSKGMPSTLDGLLGLKPCDVLFNEGFQVAQPPRADAESTNPTEFQGKTDSSTPGCAVGCLVVSLYPLWLAIKSMSVMPARELWVYGVFLGLPGLIGVFIGGRGIWQWTRLTVTGPVEMEIPYRVRLGDTFRFRLRFAFPAAEGIDDVTAVLVGEEVCMALTSGKGGSHRTKQPFGFYERPFPISQVEHLSSNVKVIAGEFPVPTDVPPTLVAGMSGVKWSVEFRIKLGSQTRTTSRAEFTLES